MIAMKVTSGGEPDRPKRVDDRTWALATDCWRPQPELRPTVHGVVQRLQEIIDARNEPARIPNFFARIFRSETI